MCRFMSAIATRDGRVLYHDQTDSHEHLVAHFNLRDTTDHDYAMQHFCRVEFVPATGENCRLQFDQPDKYTLSIDEGEVPAWMDDERKASVASTLRTVIEKMIVRGKHNILLGGSWIIAEGAEVTCAHNARIVAMAGKIDSLSGSSSVQWMYGWSSVQRMYGSSSVQEMYDSSSVQRMSDSSSVQWMSGSSSVQEMHGSSSVQQMYDSSSVQWMSGSSSVQQMYDSSSVQEMSGWSSVQEMHGSSSVQRMYGWSSVQEMSDSSSVQRMYGSSAKAPRKPMQPSV